MGADSVSSKTSVFEKVEVLVEGVGKAEHEERVVQKPLPLLYPLLTADDWFVLLDVVPRFVPISQPGIYIFAAALM